MMTDLTQMAENLKKASEQDWQPDDNAWVSEERLRRSRSSTSWQGCMRATINVSHGGTMRLMYPTVALWRM